MKLTRQEARAKIAELQKYVDELPHNNHPKKIERGMLFRDKISGRLYITNEVKSSDCRLALMSLSGYTYSHNSLFDGDEKDFEYLGKATEKLMLRPEVTDELFEKASDAYKRFSGGAQSSLRHVITLLLNGKL